MDLPTCPQCGQSVLDDDATQCPFCGASMSGKPGAAKKPPAKSSPTPKSPAPSAPAATPPEKSQPTKPKAPAGAGRNVSGRKLDPSAPMSDLPASLAIDPAARNAVAASRRPQKGRTYKIVCPMCESVGYVPRSAAGRDVRCPNPECMVPVFKAPRIEKKKTAETEPQERSSTSLVVFGIVGLLLVAGLGAGAWVLFGRDASNGEQVTLPGGISTNKTKQAPGDAASKTKVDKSPTPTETAAPAGPTMAEIQSQVLPKMVELSRDERNRKAVARSATAEAYALAGELDSAREQLEQLNNVGSDVPFYRIPPLSIIAWKQLADGDTDAAASTLEQAWSTATALPRFGRLRIDYATQLAAPLAATGRVEDAQNLVSQHQEASLEGNLSADLYWIREYHVYDLNAAAMHEPVLPWSEPQAVAVALGLAAHKRLDAALEWANKQPGDAARIETTVAWAEAVVDAGGSDAHPMEEQFASLSEGLPTGGQVRFYARVAARRFAANRNEAARQNLAKSRELLESIDVPAAVVLPEMKEFYENFSLPETATLRIDAIAAAELARVEAEHGDAEQAFGALEKSMALCRAMAPSPSAIDAQVTEIDQRGSNAIQQQLDAIFSFRNRDEARRAYRNYRGKSNDVQKASAARFALQTAILEKAAYWPLRDKVWDEVAARNSHGDLNQREPYFSTAVPWRLAQQFETAGGEEQAEQIRSQLSSAGTSPDAVVQMQQETTRLIENGDVRGAARRIGGGSRDDVLRHRWAMTLACDLVNQNRIQDAFKFVQGLDDALLREDTLDLISALATKNDHGAKVWTVIREAALSPTERISVCRGWTAGHQAAADAPQTTPAEAEATPESESASAN